MSKNNRIAPSTAGTTPSRRPASRIIAVGAVMAAAVLGIAFWWSADPANDPVNLQSKLTDTSFSAGTAAPSSPSAVKSAGTDSEVAEHRLDPPPGDLLAAIKHAQKKTGNRMYPPPAGQPAWQGMSAKDAAKVFEDAVKTSQRPYTSAMAVSPFGPDK